MSKVLTIELPEELYDSLKELSAGESEQEINERLIQIIKSFVDEKHRWLNDPIFEPITAQGSSRSDISERHDKYLYQVKNQD